MSWLDTVEYDHKYECCNGHVNVFRSRPEDRPEEVKCVVCDQVANYAGFVPIKLGGGMKVAFEKNGRKAYEFRRPDGSVGYMSQTKYHYLETGKIEPQYTNDYREHLKDHHLEHLLEGDDNEKRASASEAKNSDKEIDA